METQSDSPASSDCSETPIDAFLESFDGKPIYGFDVQGFGHFLMWDDRTDTPSQVMFKCHKKNILRLTGSMGNDLVGWKWEDPANALQDKMSSTTAMIGNLLYQSTYPLSQLYVGDFYKWRMLVQSKALSYAPDCPDMNDTSVDEFGVFCEQFKRDSMYDWATSTALVIEKLIKLCTERKTQNETYKEKLLNNAVIVFDPRKVSEIPQTFDLMIFSPNTEQWKDETKREAWISTIHENLDTDCLSCELRIKNLKLRLDAVCSMHACDLATKSELSISNVAQF